MAMGKHYQQLSSRERDQISVMRAEGHNARAIARALCRSPATICRELKRNAPPIRRGWYLAHKAQARAQERRSKASQRERLRSPGLKAFVTRKVKQGWSPEQIAGLLAMDRPEMAISHEAIYQWVYAEAPDLTQFLARAFRRRKRRGHSSKHKTSHIPQRISIKERPMAVETRQEVGHWEVDTIVSRQSLPALLIMTERKTRVIKLGLLPAKTSHHVKVAVNRRLSRLPSALRKTLTFDNGSENVEHMEINSVLGTQSYFCEPYHSWEKGSVENAAGLVRRVYPKRFDFATINAYQVRRLEDRLNSRPRKCLDYQTPNESLSQSRVALQC